MESSIQARYIMKIKKNKHKFHKKEHEQKKELPVQDLKSSFGGAPQVQAPQDKSVINILGIEDRFAKRKGDHGKHHHHF